MQPTVKKVALDSSKDEITQEKSSLEDQGHAIAPVSLSSESYAISLLAAVIGYQDTKSLAINGIIAMGYQGKSGQQIEHPKSTATHSQFSQIMRHKRGKTRSKDNICLDRLRLF